MVVETNLHILGEVEVETSTVEFGRTTVDGLLATAFVVIHVKELIFANEFDVAPAAASAHAVELGTVGVVALLATEEEAGTFHIPTLEMIRLVDADFRLHVGPIRHPGTFETQAIVVTGKFGSGDEVVMSVLDIIGVDVFLTADVGGVAAAETGTAIHAHLIGSLGSVIHDSATDVQTIICFIDRTNHDLTDIGKALVHAIVLVVGFNKVAGLLAFNLLEEHAGATEEILVGVFGEDTEVTAGSKGVDHHRALHEHEVTRRSVARHGEVGLHATDSELPVLQTVVANHSVFQLEGTVGEFHVNLTIPIRCDLSLGSKACTTDAGT